MRRAGTVLRWTPFVALAAGLLAFTDARAIQRDIFKEIRSRYEGRALRLRIDLKAAGRATDPNVVSLDGVGYPSERSPILFSALETVYLQRITNEGATGLGLTVYRSEDEANRLRASAIPGPTMANPNFGRTLATFAQQGSTGVVLELKAGKKDPQGQLAEIETLLDRVFYLKSERSEEHTSELQSPCNLVCRLLLEKKKYIHKNTVLT